MKPGGGLRRQGGAGERLSRSQRNDSFGRDSGRSRGDTRRLTFRPIEAFKATIRNGCFTSTPAVHCTASLARWTARVSLPTESVRLRSDQHRRCHALRRRPADPAAILSRSDALQIFGFLPFGLTLDEEAGLLERETGKSVKELRDLSLESFRDEIAKSNDPSRRIIINFLRTPLFGREHGHFSPVLGYLPAEDLVFVGDVNANYRPWLVPTSRLFDAQNTIDSSSHAKRGMLEVEAQ